MARLYDDTSLGKVRLSDLRKERQASNDRQFQLDEVRVKSYCLVLFITLPTTSVLVCPSLLNGRVCPSPLGPRQF